jgi:hypothetical protein
VRNATAKPEWLYPESTTPSGFFFKKKPPRTLLAGARSLWFCSKGAQLFLAHTTQTESIEQLCAE